MPEHYEDQPVAPEEPVDDPLTPEDEDPEVAAILAEVAELEVIDLATPEDEEEPTDG